jgi:hypothetical protein
VSDKVNVLDALERAVQLLADEDAALLRALREALAEYAPLIRHLYYDPSATPEKWYPDCDCPGCKLAALLALGEVEP